MLLAASIFHVYRDRAASPSLAGGQSIDFAAIVALLGYLINFDGLSGQTVNSMGYDKLACGFLHDVTLSLLRSVGRYVLEFLVPRWSVGPFVGSAHHSSYNSFATAALCSSLLGSLPLSGR